jgi:2-polyprenyl-3-methyl-5-hydroxy-6-metoxy-1,4-benzoquinol methylase
MENDGSARAPIGLAGGGLKLSPRQLSNLADDFYGGAGVGGLLQRYRPYISPLDEVIALIPRGGTILDVGCGRGLVLLSLLANDWVSQAVGVDPSRKAIQAFTESAARYPGRAVAASALEAVAGEFDTVAMLDVLHHVPSAEQQAMVSRAASLVKPGGLLIYKDMAQRPTWRALANRLHDLVLARQWIHYRALSDVEAWLAAAGLERVSGARFTRLWYAHEMVVFRRRAVAPS